MKNLINFFLILIFILKFTFLAAYSSDPKNFISELVADVIEKLSSTSLSKEEKSQFISEVALNNVDIKALGLYTLGELRKSSDKQIIENYQQAFEKYFLKNLTSRLTDYSSNKFEIIGADKKSANYTIVKTKIAQMPNNSNWYNFYGVGILTGIGFTMSLFVGNLAFVDNVQYMDGVKIGVLTGSLLSTLAGYFLILLTPNK